MLNQMSLDEPHKQDISTHVNTLTDLNLTLGWL